MKYEKLEHVIKERNISQRQLAISAGIAPQSLSAALKGTVKFWPGWRQRVAEALEMDEAELFGEGAEHDNGQ